MEHPLAMDAEAMRRAGYATVDALVARLADPEADPVLRRADAADMRARLGGPAAGAARGLRRGAGPGARGHIAVRVAHRSSRLPGLHPGLHHLAGRAGRADRGRGQPVLRRVDGVGRAHPGRAGGHRLVPRLARAARRHRGRAGERRLGRQPDGAAGGARGGGRAVPRLGGVRVGPGSFVAGPDGAGHGAAAGAGAGAADRRWLAAAAGDSHRGRSGRPGRGPRPVRPVRQRRLDQHRRRRPAGRPGRCLCRRTSLAARRRGLRGLRRPDRQGKDIAGRPRARRLGDARSAQVAVPADGVRLRADPRRGPAGADVRHSPGLPRRQRGPGRG